MLGMQRWHPAARAAVTSGAIMAVSDVVCQRLQTRKAQKFEWDAARTARFGLVGFSLHGPYFLYGFGALDKFFGPATTFGTAFKKTMTGQLSLFPLYVTLFFNYMAVLEGKGLQGGIERWKAAFLPTYASGSVFWPIANMINFSFVPATQRVPYINVCGLLWNSYLSYVNSQQVAQEEEQVHQGASSVEKVKKHR